MDTTKGSRTWVLIIEFIVALLVVSFLVVGPEGFERLTQRIRQSPPRPPAARTSAAPIQARPATARTDARPQPTVTSPRAENAQRPGASPRALPTMRPQTPPGATPVASPAATQGPRRTPASPRAVGTRPALRQRAQPQPTPTPAAATPPPLSPQQYLAKLMREGYQLYQTGWYGPAMARFKEAARVSPGSASVQLWYGRAAYRAGRLGEARAALERTMAMAPGTDAAREARSLLDRMTTRVE
jgi:TolA-binding protein